MAESEDVVRQLIAAIERFDVDEVAALYGETVVQTEHPNLLNPKGQVRGRERILADLPRGRALLARQTYHIRSLIEAGEHVAVAASWRGELAVPVAGLAAGEAMSAEIAMLFRVVDGRVVEQANYDCYPPFGR